MPRRKRTQLNDHFIYGRWKVFGEWLTLQRNNRGLTQYEAARAVKISRQQWMRYESGSKVLKKRMPAMAAALGVPLEKMLDRAGYRASPKRNAAKDRLGRIYDLLCAGCVDLAILECHSTPREESDLEEMRRNTALHNTLISQFLHFSRLIAIGDVRRGRSIPTPNAALHLKSLKADFLASSGPFRAECKHYMIHRRSLCANVSVSAQADRVQGVLQKRDNEYAP